MSVIQGTRRGTDYTSETSSMPTSHGESAKYKGIAEHVELNMTHVSMHNVKSPHLIVKRKATHVVVGVVKGTEDCVPLEAILAPLENICIRVFQEISRELGSKTKKILDTIQFVEDQLLELTKNKIHAKFPGIGKATKIFHSSLEQYEQRVLSTLQSLSVQLRKGLDVTEDLSNLFSKHRHSPFSDRIMRKWIKGKQKELKLLEPYTSILGDATFVTTRGELDKELKDNDELACFHMNLNACDDVQVANMKKHFDTNTVERRRTTDDADADDDWLAWFDYPNIKKSLHEKVNRLENYRKANPDLCCVIYTEEDNTKECGGSVIIYRHGTPIISDFRPPSSCGTPISTMNVTHDSIELQWTKPDYGKEFITNYRIHYKNANEEDTSKFIDTPKAVEKFTVKGLQPDTNYIFNVRGICEVGASPESDNSDEIRTMKKKDSLAESITKTAKCLSKDPDIYRLPLNLVKKDTEKRVRHYTFGESKNADHLPNKVLMMVGATGSGKTTLVNGMVNCMLNVQWTDPYRFKLVASDDEETEPANKEASSQTEDITVYTFYKQTGMPFEYNLIIIDSPGYGNGIDRDQEITHQIKDFFEHGEIVDHIDGVCFVTQAAGWATQTQKYIIDSILAIYAKEISENILFLVTFADGEHPAVMDSVKDANIAHKAFYKFNNSALFAHVTQGDESKSVNEIFWLMGSQNLTNLFREINHLEPKSLKLTREVLREREELETYLQALQPRIKESISQMYNLENEKEIIEKHERDIEGNKNFTYEVLEQHIVKVDLERGVYVTNCIVCNTTCHHRCAYPDDEDKEKCSAINYMTGYCNNCECFWKKHKNMQYEFITESKCIRKEYTEIKDKYFNAQKQKSDKEIVLKGLVEKYEKEKAKVYDCVRKVKLNLNRLREIALRPNPLTTTDYVDMLIESEKQTANKGFEQRIKHLEDVREQAVLLEEADEHDGDTDDLINKHGKQTAKNKGFEQRIKHQEAVREQAVLQEEADEHDIDIDNIIRKRRKQANKNNKEFEQMKRLHG